MPATTEHRLSTAQAAWSARCRAWIFSQDDQFDPSHRIDHVQRVFLNMRRLAEQEQADLNVLIPATWLHDCVAVCKKSGKRAQASTLSADAAIAWLRQEGYPEQHFDAIHHAIAAHSFSAGIPPQSLEAQVLQDADRLDALGAVGIARTMMLGGQFGSMLAHPDEPFPETRARDDKP